MLSKFLTSLLLAVVLICQSCTSIMDPDAEVLKTDIKQLKPRAKIRPVSPDKMVVFVRYKNTSGSDLDIDTAIKEDVRKAGYIVTDSLDAANYILTADLRYVGLKSKDGYGHTIFGALIGAVAGAIIGHQFGGGTTEKVVGGGIGAVVGGVAGKAIDNRNKVVTVDLVVDVSIGEKIEGGIETKRASSSNETLSQSSRSTAETGSNEAASSSTKYSESTDFVQKENFFYHENRFIASAAKLGLTYDEVRIALSGMVARSIASNLP
jgi:outer membrane lipoprotein SlyB